MTHWRRHIAPIAIVFVCPASGYATQYLSIQEAQKLCFPSASSFEAAHVIFTPQQIAEIEKESDQKVLVRGQQIWKAKNDDKTIGYFVADYVVGKHLMIDYAVALNTDLSVRDVEILQYRETYGGEIRNPDWLKQFIGKTKDSKLELNNDITNIGGATLSSRSVTEGIKRVLITLNVTKP
jgi:Na+-translocating ferredoxin:NAD+ oxidoreductase RnfG subunit